MSFILAGIVAAVCLVADQITKYIVSSNMIQYESIPFIDGLINFTYIRNPGAAWGILGGKTWLLLIFTAVIMAIVVIILVKDKLKSKLLFWSGCLIISGGIGNMIDRIFNGGEVVDFIETAFMDFPVFNIADCAVVIGAGLLILYFILDTVAEAVKKKNKEATDSQCAEEE